MTIYHLVVICAVTIAAFAQMMLKKASTVKYPSFIREYLNFWVIGGYSVMMISMVLDVWAISKGVQIKEVSTIESLSYLIVPLLGLIFYNEKISMRKFCAIAVILLGVVVFFNDFFSNLLNL